MKLVATWATGETAPNEATVSRPAESYDSGTYERAHYNGRVNDDNIDHDFTD